MRKRLIGMMLATTMVFLSLAGCGGSGGTSAAPAGEAQQTGESEKNEAAEEKDATDGQAAEGQEAAAEEQVTEAQEAAAETAETPVEEKKYLVKTITTYKLSEDGEKAFYSQSEYEYDENGNTVSLKYTNANEEQNTETEYEYDENGNPTLVRFTSSHFNYENEYEYDENGNNTHMRQNWITNNTISDIYFEYEFDEEGRILTSTVLDENKNPNGSYTEYTYSGDEFEYIAYNNDGVYSTAKGFISDGQMYETESITYSVDYPKTEDEESFYQKTIRTYEGTNMTTYQVFLYGNLIYESLSEYEKDEHNNPVTVRNHTKQYQTDTEEDEIVEYTYEEF